jgi:hypothetical protein
MKKYLTSATAGLIACATLMLLPVSATAASVEFNIGVPLAVTQPRPAYVLPQYEIDWRERQIRASEWRARPDNHGHAARTSSHGRSDTHKGGHKKHNVKKKNGR